MNEEEKKDASQGEEVKKENHVVLIVQDATLGTKTNFGGK